MGSYIEDSDYQENIKEFKDAGAFLTGHFILSSGLHSDAYVQCARVFIDAKRGERLCYKLAKNVRESGIIVDAIVAPAMGGVVVGYEMGRQLGVDTMFCERVDGVFMLRRGFWLEEGQKVLIVEDVVTTGKSSMEAVNCIKNYGAEVVAVACLIDRTGQYNNSLDHKEESLPFIPLIRIEAKIYKPDALPDDLKAIPAIKPGSRFINQKAS